MFFENNFIPSHIKIVNPNIVKLAGDCLCCVMANILLSTAEDIPDDDNKIKILLKSVI